MLLPYLNFFHFCKNWSFISLETSVPLRRFNIQNGYSQSKQANKRQKFFSKLHTPYNRKISTVLCMHACCCFSRVPWDPMDCSPPGSSAHGIIQTKILEWVAMPSSRGSSGPRDWAHVFCLGHWQVGCLTLVPPGKPLHCIIHVL